MSDLYNETKLRVATSVLEHVPNGPVLPDFLPSILGVTDASSKLGRSIFWTC
jgi:hypothetical protein